MPVSTVARPTRAHLARIRNHHIHRMPKKRPRLPTGLAAQAPNVDRPHPRHSRAQRREAACLIIRITSTILLHMSPRWPQHTPLYARRVYVPSPWKRYPGDPKPVSPQRPLWEPAYHLHFPRSRVSAPASSRHHQLHNLRPTEALSSLAIHPPVIRRPTYSEFRTCMPAAEKESTRFWHLVRTGSVWP